MNKTWAKNWQKVLIWFSGYFSFIAFILVGGYFTFKHKDSEEYKKTCKLAFVVTLIFAAISAFFTVFSCVGSIFNYYGTTAYEFYRVCTNLVSIAKIVVYTVFILLALFKKEQEKQPETTEEN